MGSANYTKFNESIVWVHSMANIKKHIDWKRIEKLYKQGLLSLEEIARESGTVSGNIRHHAKKHGWKRDLTDAVREKTRMKLIESLADNYGGGQNAAEELDRLTDEAIVEQAARTQIQVLREHQKSIGHGHKLVMRMLDELDASTAYAGELQELITSTISPHRQEAVRRAVSLGSRSTILRDLSTAARQWVQLERQAFNIPDERDKNIEKVDDVNKTASQLRKEIESEARELGLSLVALGNRDDEDVEENNKETAH